MNHSVTVALVGTRLSPPEGADQKLEYSLSLSSRAGLIAQMSYASYSVLRRHLKQPAFEKAAGRRFPDKGTIFTNYTTDAANVGRRAADLVAFLEALLNSAAAGTPELHSALGFESGGSEAVRLLQAAAVRGGGAELLCAEGGAADAAGGHMSKSPNGNDEAGLVSPRRFTHAGMHEPVQMFIAHGDSR